MIDYQPGDIVLVPFPFTDQSMTKRRPSVVISSAAYQSHRPDLIIMAITSQMGTPLTWGNSIVTYWKEAGLLKPSVIKPVVATVDKSIIMATLGHLHADDLTSLKGVVQEIISLG